jgi:HSP20 family protein
MRNHLVDVFWNPELLNFAGHFDRAFLERSTFAPALDVEETDTAYRLNFDLPGLKKEEIKIEFSGDQLIVSGERKFEKTEDKNTRHVAERGYGKFQRTITLPLAIDVDKVEAVQVDGVLHISIPKAEAVKPRLIEIKATN